MNCILMLFLMSFSFNTYSQAVDQIPREKSPALNPKWEVIPTLSTVPLKKFKGNETQIHHKTKDYVFLKRIRNTNKPLLTIENEDESFVVYNPKRKTVGTVSGVIVLNLKQINSFDSLLNDYPIKKIRLEKNMSFALVKVKKGFDIAKIFNDLKHDSRIVSAEVEVISNRMRPQ